MLKLEQVTKLYSDADRQLQIINGLTFAFPEAGSVAIVGKSGVGKSTLLNICGALDAVSSGKVLLEQHDLTALGDDELTTLRAQKIGFIYQSHQLLADFSAYENVAFAHTLAALPRERLRQDVAEILELVGLKDRMQHRPAQLSGGEQQRVSIARALVKKPALILADEPTGSLDPLTAKDIQALLTLVMKDTKSLMVMVTHNLELARTLDHVYEMQNGGSLNKL